MSESVPVEKLEALRKVAWKMCETGGSTLVPDARVLVNRLDAFAEYVIEQCDALLAEARKGGKPIPPEEVIASLTFNSDGEEIGREMGKRIMHALRHDYQWLYTMLNPAYAGTEGPGEITRHMAEWIIQQFDPRQFRPLKSIDHACAECIPGGPMVVKGFRCAHHLAIAFVEGEKK